jgi:hypothetical protein
MWLNSLRAGDVSGGKPAEIAYQKRVAGYPERTARSSRMEPSLYVTV